jgi:hypothetical protein
MFTEERISEILAVCEKATPEWKAGNFKRCIVTDAIDGSVFGDDSNREYYGGSLVAESIHPANRDFAILARTALPELARRVMELEKDNANLRATIAAMQDALEEIKARCELRRQDDDAHYENYYEAKKALAAAGYGGEE